MHVALAGPEDGEVVLLVHGWPRHWWSWRRVIAPIAESRRVIAVDLRGFGWTEVTAGGYEKERLVDDLLTLLDVLGIERVTWVGHDWGGWIGQLAALRVPERIDRMLLLAIPHLWVPRHPRQLLLLTYQGPISLPVLGSRLAARMAPSILQAGRGPNPLTTEDVRLFTARVPPAVSTAMYRTFLTRELIPIARGRYAHRKLEVPTTMILGGLDLVTNGVDAGPVSGQPQIDVRLVDRVAHWLPEQRPDLVIDWVTTS